MSIFQSARFIYFGFLYQWGYLQDIYIFLNCIKMMRTNNLQLDLFSAPVSGFCLLNSEKKKQKTKAESYFGHRCKPLSGCTCWMTKQFGINKALWQMDRLTNICSVGFIWSVHFHNNTCFWELAQHISDNYIFCSCDARLVSVRIFFFKLIQLVLYSTRLHYMNMQILTRFKGP